VIQVAIALLAFGLLIGLSMHFDKPDTWEDVVAEVSKMDSTTHYDEIVKKLGKPYEEFATPSLLEEYVLYYDAPAATDSMCWIMLDTEKKTFLYWGQEKQEK